MQCCLNRFVVVDLLEPDWNSIQVNEHTWVYKGIHFSAVLGGI